MPPRKSVKSATLEAAGPKIGSPVPKGIVNTATGEVGAAVQPAYDPGEEFAAVRKQLETLQKQVSDAAQTIKSGARKAARQTEATVKLYPVSTMIAVAAAVGGSPSISPGREHKRENGSTEKVTPALAISGPTETLAEESLISAARPASEELPRHDHAAAISAVPVHSEEAENNVRDKVHGDFAKWWRSLILLYPVVLVSTSPLHMIPLGSSELSRSHRASKGAAARKRWR